MVNLQRLLLYNLCFLIAFLSSHSRSGFVLSALVLIVVGRRIHHTLIHGLNCPVRPWKWRTLFILFVAASGAVAMVRPWIVPWWDVAWRGLILAVLGWVLIKPGMPRWAWISWPALGLVLIPPVAALHPLHTLPKRTPAALGLAYEEVEFRTTDGLLLSGWLMRHPEARGNVVCCHGHGRNRGHLVGMWQTFHDLKLNVLVFDFRGHGWSEGNTCTLGQGEVEDVVAAEAFLQHCCPNQPSFLVGISLGGASALRSLPRMPWVKGVWSEGAYARLRPVVDHEFDVLPRWIAKPLVTAYQFLAWLDCDLCIDRVNPVESLRGQTVPVFFCHGEEDALIPFEHAEILSAGYAGPQEHWWVPDATHHNIRQHHHDEYLQRLQVWLEARMHEESRFMTFATPPS